MHSWACMRKSRSETNLILENSVLTGAFTGDVMWWNCEVFLDRFGIQFYFNAKFVPKILATIYDFVPDWQFHIGLDIVISPIFDKKMFCGDI